MVGKMSDEYDPFEEVWRRLEDFNTRLIACEQRLASKVVSPPLPPPSRGWKPEKKSAPAELSIAKLREGDKDITLPARISTISQVREGTTKEGNEWKNITTLIGDSSGQIEVVLWNEDVNLYNNLMQGNYITIEGGYVKVYNNKLQLRLAKTGKIRLAEEHIL